VSGVAKDRLHGIHRARSATSRIHENVPLRTRIEPDVSMASLVCHKCQRRPCHGGSTFPIAQLWPVPVRKAPAYVEEFSMYAIQSCIVYSHPYHSYRSLSPTGSFIGGRVSQALCFLRKGVRALVGHIASCRRICALTYWLLFPCLDPSGAFRQIPVLSSLSGLRPRSLNVLSPLQQLIPRVFAFTRLMYQKLSQ
jgi:hypothetical protein